MKIPHFFTNILGLNIKDITVYLDLLQFGSSAVSTISTRTNIERTTAHAVIKRLMRKGYVTRTLKKNASLFSALEPNVFEEKIKLDLEQKRTDLRIIKSFIPQLENIEYQETNRPSIKIFAGANGIISLYELLLHSSKKQDAFLTIEKIPKPLKKYLTQEYIKHKIAKNVQSRVLIENSSRARRYRELDKTANRITKLIPKGRFPFETEIIIGDSREIAIIDFSKEMIGVLINSSSIRNTLAAVFDLLWEAS